MDSKVQLIAEEASSLERHERVAIIEKLLESLEVPTAEDRMEIEKEWRDEIRRRSGEIKSGDVESVPWNQVKAEGEKLIDGD
jgi:putative addiction module component (TIGR02574 family)